MKRKDADLIPIEFNAGPGSSLRRRIKRLEKPWQVLMGSSFLVVYLAVFLACVTSPDRALLTVPLVFLLAAVVFICFTRDEIVLGKGGISFPTILGHQLQYSYIRLWTELDKAEILSPFSGNEIKAGRGSVIRVTFRSGARIILPLASFSRDGLISFVSAVEKWGTECKLDKQFPQLPRLYDFETSNPGADKGAYTRFWEEELSDNYSFTAFVPLSPGRRLQDNRLVVLKELAAGGFSAIYLVRDEEHGQRILKESVLPQECDESTRDKVKAQFVREGMLLVKLSHPNIARVFDHFVENGRNYLLLEYIEGPDLRDYVRKNGPQSEERVLKWGRQIAETLAFLHTRDPAVVHRDVTPDNIVVAPSGELVLIDFGAANEFVGTATGTLIGKQSYMAPEQIRGKATPQSDIYGLGASIYYLLTGKDPEPLGVPSIRSQIETISSETDSLIQQMTRLDLDKRLPDAPAVRSSIDEILGKLQPVV